MARKLINIKKLLIMRDIKQADIARAAGLTKGTVSAVVNRKRKSTRVRWLVADALGMKFEILWPENGRERRSA